MNGYGFSEWLLLFLAFAFPAFLIWFFRRLGNKK